jgi:hypothetical protein
LDRFGVQSERWELFAVGRSTVGFVWKEENIIMVDVGIHNLDFDCELCHQQVTFISKSKLTEGIYFL